MGRVWGGCSGGGGWGGGGVCARSGFHSQVRQVLGLGAEQFASSVYGGRGVMAEVVGHRASRPGASSWSLDTCSEPRVAPSLMQCSCRGACAPQGLLSDPSTSTDRRKFHRGHCHLFGGISGGCSGGTSHRYGWGGKGQMRQFQRQASQAISDKKEGRRWGARVRVGVGCGVGPG